MAVREDAVRALVAALEGTLQALADEAARVAYGGAIPCSLQPCAAAVCLTAT
jgi:hypothetical protein